MDKEWRNMLIVMGVFVVVVYIIISYTRGGFNTQGNSVNNPITGMAVSDTDPNTVDDGEVVEIKSELYKNDQTFTGDSLGMFVFEDISDVNECIFLYEKLGNLSRFKDINDFLYKRYYVIILNDSDKIYSAWYAGNGVIEISKNRKCAKNLDSYLTHEMVHGALEGLNLPIWLEEGIADYEAKRYFDVEGKIVETKYIDILNWTDYTYNQREVSFRYAYAEYVVKHFADIYGKDKIRLLLIELDNKIKYTDSDDEKNRKVLEAFRSVANSELDMADITNPNNRTTSQ